MAIGQLDLQEYVSCIRSAESDATLKAQAVEKGSMQIEATKKATADEETMRKGLADIYAEKPKTDTPEPPKATETTAPKEEAPVEVNTCPEVPAPTTF